eukprot:INCI1194.1.p1 GENE.INCI1194.1~~INCI1194.1.p1  ORF type:complete len:183 (+),score=30.49 INCI1194.1:1056-1604(+)
MSEGGVPTAPRSEHARDAGTLAEALPLTQCMRTTTPSPRVLRHLARTTSENTTNTHPRAPCNTRARPRINRNVQCLSTTRCATTPMHKSVLEHQARCQLTVCRKGRDEAMAAAEATNGNLNGHRNAAAAAATAAEEEEAARGEQQRHASDSASYGVADEERSGRGGAERKASRSPRDKRHSE